MRAAEDWRTLLDDLCFLRFRCVALLQEARERLLCYRVIVQNFS